MLSYISNFIDTAVWMADRRKNCPHKEAHGAWTHGSAEKGLSQRHTNSQLTLGTWINPETMEHIYDPMPTMRELETSRSLGMTDNQPCQIDGLNIH